MPKITMKRTIISIVLIIIPLFLTSCNRESHPKLTLFKTIASRRITPVAFSMDGKTLAYNSEHFILYSIESEKSEYINLKIFDRQLNTVQAISFSPDGQYIACSVTSGVIRLWRLFDGVEAVTVDWNDHIKPYPKMSFRNFGGNNQFKRIFTRISFSPDSRYLASGSYAEPIILKRVEDGVEGIMRRASTGGVSSFSFSPDGRYIASISDQVRLWNFADGTESLVYKYSPGSSPFSVSFSPNGQYLACSGSDSNIRILSVGEDSTGTLNASEFQTLRGRRNNWVKSFSFSPDSRYIASAGRDGTIILWHVADGKVIQTIEDESDFVSSVCFSPDGSFLASSSQDRKIKLWQVKPTVGRSK